ncbi:acetyl-CoA carboxylase carboxyltransferase subunit beta [Alicyclobacillaceae bacterium I2511]|nr:acetyl-CoA carboxylase carboxyltransferase subunit beta [Alicyclobacillaceae bacterium I2511]
MLRDLFKKRQYATVGEQVSKPMSVTEDELPAKDIPKGLVNKCESCGELLMAKELQKNAYTCPHCGHHFSVDAPSRIALTLDSDTFEEFDVGISSVDPLNFPGYTDKVHKAQVVSGLPEGIVTGRGEISGFPVVIGVMDSRFIMGSMGSAVGEKLTRAMEKSWQLHIPLILFTASGGARMQEGILSLMQMAKTSAALQRLQVQGTLFVTVITHPTTGGVSASFASLGDIILAEPGALFGFAGRRVIEQTIRQNLPDDFQTAEFMLKHGMVDKVVHRIQLRDTLATILRVHGLRGGNFGDTTGF